MKVPVRAMQHLHTDPLRGVVQFYLPKYVQASFDRLAEKAHEKRGGYMKVTFEMIGAKRSTGPRSQNNHVKGHCRQISGITGNGMRTIEEAMLEYAMNWCEYPFEVLPDKREKPIPFEDATQEDGAKLINGIHLWFTEWLAPEGHVLVEGDWDETAIC